MLCSCKICCHFFQIGLTSYLEMFKRAPESLSMFPFLKHLSNEDLEFYSQLRDHAVRVTGVLSMLIRQVRANPSFPWTQIDLKCGLAWITFSSHLSESNSGQSGIDTSGLTWIVNWPEWHFQVIGLRYIKVNPELIHPYWPGLWIDLKYAFICKYKTYPYNHTIICS